VFFFSLVGGAVADSFNRRKILLISQTSMAFLAFLLAWLTFQGRLQLWHIYFLTALQAVAVSFDLPARQALVPNLVPARDLPNAFSMNSIAFNFGAVAGPALGGLVIARLGLGYTYLFNSISFLGVLLALIAMGAVEQARPASRRQLVSLQGIRDGINFILHSPIIFSTMIMDFVATFFSSANTLMPIVARDILKVGAQEYGWLISAQAIGSISAAFVISQMREIRRQGRVFLTSVIIFGLATVGFGFSNTFMTAMLALVLIGAADSVSTVIRNTIRQLQTPDQLRGRMTSINQIFFQGGPQLGEVEAGIVAQFFGAPIAIISGGVACIIGVFMIMGKWPMLRDYNGVEPTPVAAD
jgi:MFS family permease